MFTGKLEDSLRCMPRCYLHFETGPLVLTDLYSLTWYLAKQTRPADQGAPEICELLPVQFWKHKCTPQYPGFVWVGPGTQAQILRLTGKTVFFTLRSICPNLRWLLCIYLKFNTTTVAKVIPDVSVVTVMLSPREWPPGKHLYSQTPRVAHLHWCCCQGRREGCQALAS